MNGRMKKAMEKLGISLEVCTVQMDLGGLGRLQEALDNFVNGEELLDDNIDAMLDACDTIESIGKVLRGQVEALIAAIDEQPRQLMAPDFASEPSPEEEGALIGQASPT